MILKIQMVHNTLCCAIYQKLRQDINTTNSLFSPHFSTLIDFESSFYCQHYLSLFLSRTMLMPCSVSMADDIKHTLRKGAQGFSFCIYLFH